MNVVGFGPSIGLSLPYSMSGNIVSCLPVEASKLMILSISYWLACMAVLLVLWINVPSKSDGNESMMLSGFLRTFLVIAHLLHQLHLKMTHETLKLPMLPQKYVQKILSRIHCAFGHFWKSSSREHAKQIFLSNPPGCHHGPMHPSEPVIAIGCGAGFAGDRPAAAAKLLQYADLDYLVLECLAERTLAAAAMRKRDGGVGYDPRITQWLNTLLPVLWAKVTNKSSNCKSTVIITNMGAADPYAAAQQSIKVASHLGIPLQVSVLQEIHNSSHLCQDEDLELPDAGWTYLGADAISEALDKLNTEQTHPLHTKPLRMLITGRVADPSLFLGAMIHEFRWNMDDLPKLAQGTAAAHLIECGCHVTGGYFSHPQGRNLGIDELVTMSLPYVTVSADGNVVLRKLAGSGGELSQRTCAKQLLYEVENPKRYITPDIIADFSQVHFCPITNDAVAVHGARASRGPGTLLRLLPKDGGWSASAEISYGGLGCEQRAQTASQLVMHWLQDIWGEEVTSRIHVSMIGRDSLYGSSNIPKVYSTAQTQDHSIWRRIFSVFRSRICIDKVIDLPEVRLRLAGRFSCEEHAKALCDEVMALYTNGPAGGAGVSSKYIKEIALRRQFVDRSAVVWKTFVLPSCLALENVATNISDAINNLDWLSRVCFNSCLQTPSLIFSPAPAGVPVQLYSIAQSHAGDKGDTITLSLIPNCPTDLTRIRSAISEKWLCQVFSPLLSPESVPTVYFEDSCLIPEDDLVPRIEVYNVDGVSSLNIVVRGCLDGGVTTSRRIDRHGKSLSDWLLQQVVVLPK